jgi:hypothetical protein
MRRIFLLSAAMLFAAFQSFSQTPKKGKAFASHISLGPVASLGHSWVSNISGDRDFKFAPAVGIGMVYSTNEHLGFGAQLLVSHEGYKREVTLQNGEQWDMSVNPVYLRLPLHVIYFFGNYGDRVRPKIYAGPSFAARVDEVHYYTDDQMRPAEGSPEASHQFNTFDAGLTAGIGANIRLSLLSWLNFDVGYYNGLVDVVDGVNANNGFNGNRDLRLNVGVMWGL